MPATVLVDTNVLVYRHDPRDRRKQDQALGVFRQLVEAERAVTCAQCLTEFYRVVTQKLPEPLSPDDALSEVGRYLEILPVLDVTPSVAFEACRAAAAGKLSLWAGLVWACAKLNRVPYVLTEDGPTGRSIEVVAYVDPFAPGFELAALLS